MYNLDEIIKPRKSKRAGAILDEYEDSSVIAGKIYKEFIKLYVDGKGFPLDDRTLRYGLISNCMALSTILELIDLDAKPSGDENKYGELLGSIFAELYPDGVNRPVFSASPYIKSDDENVHLDSYVETISKVLITMVDLRTTLLDNNIEIHYPIRYSGRAIESKEKLISFIENLIVVCIEAINKCCLPNNTVFKYKINGETVERDRVDSVVNFRGWTYCQADPAIADNYDVSIYFTYHATNAFLSFYQTFSRIFDAYFENKEFNLDDIKETKRERVKLDKIFFDNNIDIISEFRQKTISAGRYFETKMTENGVNLALDYVGKDLRPVSFDGIVNSQKSNDVINTVLVLSILINSGLDDDYASKGQKNYLYEQLQFGMNNVKKIYSILKKNSNEDVVNSYRLIFNEKYPKKELPEIQYLRRQCDDIAVYDFVPAFCNTYATVSQYLIQYPQREMVDNLAMIMENRMSDRWLWSKEGYNINNNLYYILALENFYDYYKEYELPLSAKGEKYNDKAKKAEEDMIKIANERNDLESRYNALVVDYENKQSNLDREVYEIAEKAIEKGVDAAIKKFFDAMIDDAIGFAMEVVTERKRNTNYLPGERLYDKYPGASIMHRLASPEFYINIAAGKEINRSDLESLKEDIDNEIINKRFKDIGEILRDLSK